MSCTLKSPNVTCKFDLNKAGRRERKDGCCGSPGRKVESCGEGTEMVERQQQKQLGERT